MPHNTRSRGSNSAAGRQNRSTSASSSSNTPATPVLPTLPSPQESTRTKCEYVLKVLNLLDISFGAFIDVVSYGDASLRNSDLARTARGSFYAPGILSSVLKNLYEPPGASSGGGPRPVGGSKTTRTFIFETALGTFRSELNLFSKDYRLSDEELADIDFVSRITSKSLHTKAKNECPQLYGVLSALTNPRLDEPDDDPDETGEERGERTAIARHPHFVS
ncbi:hypothetical protein FRC08_000549 [Ceratobasidium sp. 394]|nr:hypothetical protein FRC08_000549 [Ceratobasidium sp. 394]KAG9087000.1 hypothetical protein FS749_003235 [Ceratobasidium sp. UAMH 11750]